MKRFIFFLLALAVVVLLRPDASAQIGYGKQYPGTMASRDNPWLDVRHPAYGCKGDGTTDDTPCFTAVTAACSADQTIYLPAGTYSTTGLTLPDGCSLIGAGDGTIIKARSGTSILLDTTAVSDNRAKRISNLVLDLNDEATTGLYLDATSSWKVDHIWINGNSLTDSSKCIHLDGTQNSLIEISEFKQCEYGIYLENSAANNLFFKNEVTRSGTAHVYATDTGVGMHGNTFIGNIYERGRDGTNCGPTYGVYLEAGRQWRFIADGVNTPPSTAHWFILGPDSPQKGAAAGAYSVYLENTNQNLNTDACGSPQDWSTDGGIYAQGIYEVNIENHHVVNGSGDNFLEARGNCSITTATECCDDGDCTGGETCVYRAKPSVEHLNWGSSGEPTMICPDNVATQTNDRSSDWVMGNRVAIVDETDAGNDQLDISTTGDYNASIRIREYTDNTPDDTDYRIQANSGALDFKDLLGTANTRFQLGSNDSGFASIGGTYPGFYWRDVDLYQGTEVASNKVQCNGIATAEDCDMFWSTMRTATTLEQFMQADASTQTLNLLNSWTSGTGFSAGGGSPGGDTDDIQVNDGASGFTGEDDFEYDPATNTLKLNGTFESTATDGGGTPYFNLDINDVTDPTTDEVLRIWNSQTSNEYMVIGPYGEFAVGSGTADYLAGSQLSFFGAVSDLESATNYYGVYGYMNVDDDTGAVSGMRGEVNVGGSVTIGGNVYGGEILVTSTSSAPDGAGYNAAGLFAQAVVGTNSSGFEDQEVAGVRAVYSAQGDYRRGAGVYVPNVTGGSTSYKPAATAGVYATIPSDYVGASATYCTDAGVPWTCCTASGTGTCGGHYGVEVSSMRTSGPVANKASEYAAGLKIGFPREFNVAAGHIVFADAGGADCSGTDGSTEDQESKIGGCPAGSGGPPGAKGFVYFDDGTTNTVGLYEHDGSNWRPLYNPPAGASGDVQYHDGATPAGFTGSSALNFDGSQVLEITTSSTASATLSLKTNSGSARHWLQTDSTGDLDFWTRAGGGTGDHLKFMADGAVELSSNDPCFEAIDLGLAGDVSFKLCAQEDGSGSGIEDVDITIVGQVGGTDDVARITLDADNGSTQTQTTLHDDITLASGELQADLDAAADGCIYIGGKDKSGPSWCSVASTCPGTCTPGDMCTDLDGDGTTDCAGDECYFAVCTGSNSWYYPNDYTP